MKPRFYIRDLLWLVALCAVLVAWWIDHRRISAIAAKFEADVRTQHEEETRNEAIRGILRQKDQQLREILDELARLHSERTADQAEGGTE